MLQTPPPYYLAQDIQGNIFQSFPLLQIYDSKKANKSNKDQSSLFDHPAIGLILFDHFLLLMKKTQTHDEVTCPHHFET